MTTRLKLIARLLTPRLGRSGPWVMLLLAAAAQVLYTLYIRDKYGTLTPTFEGLTSFNFEPYVIGQVVQELVLPVAIVYLFSGAPFFRRVALGQARAQDYWPLLAAFAAAQLAFFGYIYMFESRGLGQLTKGGLVVLLAGYLGGWRVGLGLGVLTWLLVGVNNLLLWPPEETGNIWDTFYWYVVVSREGGPSIWLGLSAGLIALALGKRRFAPLPALLLGLYFGTLTRYLIALTQYEPRYTVQALVPIAVTTGVALAGLALIVRNIQSVSAQRQAEVSELALTQAELKALRSQINPHFLFNSLNTIRYFVRTEPDTARRLLLSLSEVFQKALRSGELVSLKDEIDYVEAYLELEQARLGERLTVSWQLPEERLLQTPVPALVLQPLVENAVIHGVSKRSGGGAVNIRVERWDDDLTLEVRDDGGGFNAELLKQRLESPVAPTNNRRQPIGLANINQRLRLLYGPDYRLRIESGSSGTRAQVRVPLGKAHLDAFSAPQALPHARPAALGPAPEKSNRD